MPQRPNDRRPAARLGEPISEEFVGRSDLTHWSRLGQWLVRFVLITSRLVSAHTVLLVSAVVGAALVTALSTASAEIYDNVKDADGLSGLDEPALELAMSLRNPANVAVIQFFTNLGGWLELTIITASVW